MGSPEGNGPVDTVRTTEPNTAKHEDRGEECTVCDCVTAEQMRERGLAEIEQGLDATCNSPTLCKSAGEPYCLLDRLRERLKSSTFGASKGDHRKPFSIALLDQAEDPLVSGALDPHGLFRSAMRAVKHQPRVHGDATVTTFRSGRGHGCLAWCVNGSQASGTDCGQPCARRLAA